MKILTRVSILTLSLLTGLVVGCGSNTQSSTVASKPTANPMDTHGASDQATIAEAMAKLSPEDRSLAESQKFCAVATTSPLGSMGTPFKLDVDGETVFLCCSGCKTEALSHPQETLASVAKLKSENTVSK